MGLLRILGLSRKRIPDGGRLGVFVPYAIYMGGVNIDSVGGALVGEDITL